MDSKVNNIVDKIRTENIEEFYFKQSIEEGYYLKLDNDSIYLTPEEAESLLKQLHIKTDSIILRKFNLNHEKEAYINRILSSIHDLGLLKADINNVNATKEDLIQCINYLKQLTKDKDLAELDVDSMLKEELYNILHRKHLKYYYHYKDIILTEVNSGSFSSWYYFFFRTFYFIDPTSENIIVIIVNISSNG